MLSYGMYADKQHIANFYELEPLEWIGFDWHSDDRGFFAVAFEIDRYLI